MCYPTEAPDPATADLALLRYAALPAVGVSPHRRDQRAAPCSEALVFERTASRKAPVRSSYEARRGTAPALEEAPATRSRRRRRPQNVSFQGRSRSPACRRRWRWQRARSRGPVDSSEPKPSPKDSLGSEETNRGSVPEGLPGQLTRFSRDREWLRANQQRARRRGVS